MAGRPFGGGRPFLFGSVVSGDEGRKVLRPVCLRPGAPFLMATAEESPVPGLMVAGPKDLKDRWEDEPRLTPFLNDIRAAVRQETE